MMQRFLFSLLGTALFLTGGYGQPAESQPDPAFKIGMFDQAGVQTFIQANENLEGDALDQALTNHIRALALENEAALVFFHSTQDSDPFILANLPVEVIVLNSAMDQPTPTTTKDPVSLPDEVKVGTLQIQAIVDQILSNETIQQKIQEQYMLLDGVSDIMEDLEFYQKILQEIEEETMEPQKVRQKYGMSKEQLAGLQAQAYQKYESSRDAFNQQFVEFYVRLVLQAAALESEEEGFTHVFQFQNGPAPRLAFKQESDTIQNITGGVAKRLNSLEPSENPDLEMPDLPQSE